MTKKQVIQIVVIAALVFIWGRVFYRMYKNIKVTNVVNQVQPQSFVPIAEINLFDTFNIKVNYRDPFLNKSSPVKTHNNDNQGIAPPIKIVKQPEIKLIQWPNVTYLGFISDRNTNKKMAIANVNNVSSKIFVGSKIGEIVISKIYKDSIEIKMGKETRVVKK